MGWATRHRGQRTLLLLAVWPSLSTCGFHRRLLWNATFLCGYLTCWSCPDFSHLDPLLGA